MSSAKAIIEEYRISTASKDQPLTKVPFAETRIGDLDIVIVSKDKQLHEELGVSEEEIERQLAEEGLIQIPPASQQPTGEFKRVNVGGMPMSEMIIEERR